MFVILHCSFTNVKRDIFYIAISYMVACVQRLHRLFTVNPEMITNTTEITQRCVMPLFYK